MQPTPTRRGLITGAVGLTSAAALAGAAAAPAAAASPAQALSVALELERVGVIAYRKSLASGVLSETAAAQVRVLMAHELIHVARLEQALTRLAAQPPQGPATVNDAQAVLTQHQVYRSLTNLPTQHDCLALLIDIESLTEGAYFSAIPQLVEASLVKLSLELMGSDSQHWTVLSGIQHGGDVGQSVPYPFVEGSP